MTHYLIYGTVKGYRFLGVIGYLLHLMLITAPTLLYSRTLTWYKHHALQAKGFLTILFINLWATKLGSLLFTVSIIILIILGHLITVPRDSVGSYWHMQVHWDIHFFKTKMFYNIFKSNNHITSALLSTPQVSLPHIDFTNDVRLLVKTYLWTQMTHVLGNYLLLYDKQQIGKLGNIQDKSIILKVINGFELKILFCITV